MRFNNLEKVESGTNQSDKLYRNDNGHFTDVSKDAALIHMVRPELHGS
jgi:hypothetical protein